MKKLLTLFGLFKRGQAMANPDRWKKRQVTANGIAGLLWAVVRVAEAYGYDLQMETATIDSLAVAILSVVNFVLTITANEDVGVRDRNNKSLMDKGDKSSH